MSQQVSIAELREKNEIVINKHIAALNAAGGMLTQFLEVLTANAVLTSENEKLKSDHAAKDATIAELEARLAALAPKAVESDESK